MLVVPQEESGFSRRKFSRRRSFKCGLDTDDRGWTSLHIGARKGDVKEAPSWKAFSRIRLGRKKD